MVPLLGKGCCGHLPIVQTWFKHYSGTSYLVDLTHHHHHSKGEYVCPLIKCRRGSSLLPSQPGTQPGQVLHATRNVRTYRNRKVSNACMSSTQPKFLLYRYLPTIPSACMLYPYGSIYVQRMTLSLTSINGQQSSPSFRRDLVRGI